MTLRNPIIIDRGPDAVCQFVCQSRSDSLMCYAGLTADRAYESWAKHTRAGRWHKHKRGFNESYIKTKT